MKSFNALFLLFISISIFSCSKKEKEEVNPVTSDFSVTIEGEAPNAIVIVINNSSEASFYEWELGPGLQMDSTKEQSQSKVFLKSDRAGSVDIKLKSVNGSESATQSKTIEIGGYSAVKTFKDIPFAIDKNNIHIPRFFSTEKERSYLNYEVDKTNGILIDLALSVNVNGELYFTSPDNPAEKFDIPSATRTAVQNSVQTELTISDFDNMISDEKIKGLKIENDNKFFDPTVPQLILFHNGYDKKGVIKITGINGERILADIKIQKY